MRVMLITDEIWNDRVFGNNVLQNWFEDMTGVEFAQICATPGKPLNTMCERYFQITDMMVLKSLMGCKAGESFIMTKEQMLDDPQTQNYIVASSFYSFMKKISGSTVRLIREFLWSVGRYNKTKLKQFIDEFHPDLVFCPRKLSWKLMRIERMVSKFTDAPFVAFTGDDEASFREVSYSPLFWSNTYLFHRALKKHASLYTHYFMLSADQAKEYRDEYGVETSTLFKCGVFPERFQTKMVGTPIKMVYAGRLYCNRWKSLLEIGKALRIINREGIRIVLDIYTQDVLTDKQKKALCVENFIFLKGSVTAQELKTIYQNADIALHVESLDKRNRLLTRVSFSTKIIDLMASTCAIIAICWDEHTGYKYLKEQNAAFCIHSYSQILPTLQRICDNPTIIGEYAQKAYYCGIRNHNKKDVQQNILQKFYTVITKSRKSEQG